MAQLISLLELRIISFVIGNRRNANHNDICVALNENSSYLQEMMREDDYEGFAAYTEAEFTEAFRRLHVANWPLLSTRSYVYAVGMNRVMLPHEISEDQRIRIAGSWILQEQNTLEANVKLKSYLRGVPLKNLLEISFEEAFALSGEDETSKWAVPPVQHAAETMSVDTTAVEDFLHEPHPTLCLWPETLAKLCDGSGGLKKVISFPTRRAAG